MARRQVSVRGTMESVTNVPDENTAGNSASLQPQPDTVPEKLLPAGTPSAVPTGVHTPAAQPPAAVPVMPAAEAKITTPEIPDIAAFSEMPAGVSLPEVHIEDQAENTPEKSVIEAMREKHTDMTASSAEPKSVSAKNPAMLQAMNMLYTGNAVAAAQAAHNEKAAEPAPTPDSEGPGSEPFERNLREVGLKEALPRADRPAPERAEAPSKTPQGGTPRIRTYAADMGAEIEKRGATISSIVTAEKLRADTPPPIEQPQRNHRNMLVIAAVFFILLGGGALITAFVLSRAPTAPQTPEGIIPVNGHVRIDEVDASLAQTLAGEKNAAALTLGDVEALDVYKNGALLSAYDVLTALGAPNELARNATGITVGVHAFNHTQPFMLISVSTYDRSFAAMLDWEKTIGDSLDGFFAPPTAQSGISARAPALSFTDRVVANLDVRESQSDWPIVYAFPRQNLLLITTNEATLREILTRLALGSSAVR